MAKTCPSFKQAWVAYCKSYGEGFSDPGKYDDSYISEFVDYAAGLITADLASGDVAADQAPTGQKRKAGEQTAQPAKLAKVAAAAPEKKKITIRIYVCICTYEYTYV